MRTSVCWCVREGKSRRLSFYRNAGCVDFPQSFSPNIHLSTTSSFINVLSATFAVIFVLEGFHCMCLVGWNCSSLLI